MRLTFIGADHEVTGSCHFLEVGNKKALIDCGMEQGKNIYVNHDLPVMPGELDYIFVTHAHIDHTGLIPLMVKRGFKGQIFATKATCELCNIMLRDSAHIQEFEAEWRNRKAKRADKEMFEPIYNMEDAIAACELFVPLDYEKQIEICDEISVKYVDAGHLLGSASIKMTLTEGDVTKTVAFSGDIGNIAKPIIKDPVPIDQADYVLIESTYGDRLHGERPDYVASLTEILNETFAKGGNVVIPSFAVGRTQEMLYFLRVIKEEKRVTSYPDFEVYVDSPLAIEATNIFGNNVVDCFDDETKELINKGINPIRFDGLKVSVTSNDSVAINENNTPKVILSASGMCEAGRIRHHLKHNLWKPQNTILFVGYQAIGTVGRELLEGATSVKLFGEEIAVKAAIKSLKGVSGHGDQNGLIDWIHGMKVKPEKVFIVHGEDTVCDYFARLLSEHYGYNTYAPFSGTIFDLATGCLVEEAPPIRIQTTDTKKKHSGVYERLLAAGQRLLAVIKRNEGGANKDLAKFADQINALCDKWDR
ncbi:MAG: MBL fold metallo-hydrolase [Lachnospiraceae bacterium]|nr:MBL fold metallo-hydrolase [Lachnospiraceae bacterium]